MSRRVNLKLFASAALLVAGGLVAFGAMDRWTALSLIESGNNDRAIGPYGEISRYEVKPEIWTRYAPTNAHWTNPEVSLAVAKRIMQERCAAFERSFKRPPNDFEFYVLWNAPAQIQKPSTNVTERAERFRNLMNSGR